MKTELVNQRGFTTKDEPSSATFRYIAHFYNPRRRHKGFAQKSAAPYDKMLAAGSPEHATAPHGAVCEAGCSANSILSARPACPKQTS